MTESEYRKTGCDNYGAKFTFTDGSIAYGVITTFFGPHDDNYYLVTNNNLIEYKKHFDNRDDESMKRLAIPIDLSKLANAVRHTPQSRF